MNYSVILDLKDRVSYQLNKIQKKLNNMRIKSVDTSQFTNSLNKAQRRMQNFSQYGINQVRQSAYTMIGAFVSLKALKSPIDVMSNYETAFTNVKKSVDGTSKELEILNMKMQAFKGMSYTEITDIVSEAGKMGLAANNIMEFSNSIIKGAVALDMNGAEAINQVGKMLSMMNLMDQPVKNANELMDMVANLENKLASVKARDLLNIGKRTAGLMASLKVSKEEAMALNAVMSQLTPDPETAATSFRILINRLTKEFPSLIKMIEKNGAQGFINAFKEIDKLAISSGNKRLYLLKKFGAIGSKYAQNFLETKNIDKLTKALNVAKNSIGSVDREWGLFTSTFKYKTTDLQKSFMNFLNKIGIALEPWAASLIDSIKPVLDTFSKWAENPYNQKIIQDIIALGIELSALALIFGAFKLAIGLSSIALGPLSFAITLLIPLFLKLGNVIKMVSVSTGLMNMVMRLNPIGMVTLAITGLIGTMSLLYLKGQSIIKFFKDVTLSITGFLKSIPFVGKGFSLIESIVNKTKSIGSKLLGFQKEPVLKLKNQVNNLVKNKQVDELVKDTTDSNIIKTKPDNSLFNTHKDVLFSNNNNLKPNINLNIKVNKDSKGNLDFELENNLDNIKLTKQDEIF